MLFRALNELEVHPADFFADALGSVDALTVFLSQAAALSRKSKPPRILDLERQRTGKESDRADLCELEGQRRAGSRLVLRRAHALIRSLEDRLVPELLGIYACALRRLGRLDQAQIVLARALELATENADPRSADARSDAARSAAAALRGDLLRRAARISAGRGDHRGAVALAEKAALAFVAGADFAGIGKSLVDQGVWLGHLGHRRRAIRVFESALDAYLPAASDRPDVRRHRCSCLKNLGTYHLELGELDDARRYAALARESGEGLEPELY